MNINNYKLGVKTMLNYKCMIRQENLEPIILIVHADSAENIKTTVESTFGIGSLLYSEPFRI